LLAGALWEHLQFRDSTRNRPADDNRLPQVIYVAEIDVTNPEAYGKEFAPKAQSLSKSTVGEL
jgi:hypothetical protein